MPLDGINKESKREKSIRHGHPSTLHLWWARRPLASCRAVLFAQLVDDPSTWPEKFPTDEDQERERKRLFGIAERISNWENAHEKGIVQEARREIARSIAWGRNVAPPIEEKEVNRFLLEYGPHIRDPFCGGGSIPLEAQRLGLTATGSDLNPVAVMVSKATCEIPARFVNVPPVGGGKERPTARQEGWSGTRGLADDIGHYASRMRAEAWRRIGHLYPDIRITAEMAQDREELRPLVDKELTVIAWLWSRTVASPDPSKNGHHVPLVRSFDLSTKKGSPAWIEPVVYDEAQAYRFRVRTAGPKGQLKGTVTRQGGRCLLSGAAMPFPYIRAEGQAGRLGRRLMAIVAAGPRGRVFLAPTPEMEKLAQQARPTWKPDGTMPEKALGFRVQEYGMLQFSDLFTDRQLVALTTFSDLIAETREEVIRDALAAGMSGHQTPLHQGGSGAVAYGDAIATYLALAVDKAADYWSSICSWHSSGLKIRNTFARQAIPMIWDFAETNPFSHSSGNWSHCCRWISKVVGAVPGEQGTSVRQEDAAAPRHQISESKFTFATDPPYFDNIGYADLSDFFYVWLRHSLRSIWPELFATMQVPKEDEIIASPHRHGGLENAQQAFMERMKKMLSVLAQTTDPAFPSTLFYAYKQTEKDRNGIVSTGWASFLQAMVEAGLVITGTWPIRTELTSRPVASNANALASSVVLVCRSRSDSAPRATRGEFLSVLRKELPTSLQPLRSSGIAPVDLAQAAVGQGMSVFTRYKAVLETDDSRMQVRTALQLINSVLDESLATQDVEYDPYTRFALTWFESFGFDEQAYGEAEKLGVAKDVEIESMQESVLYALGGKARLLKPDESSELESDDPVWKCIHRMIWLNNEQGESAVAASMALIEDRKVSAIKELAYRLYRICEHKQWAVLSRDYNSLIASWEGIRNRMSSVGTGEQQTLITD